MKPRSAGDVVLRAMTVRDEGHLDPRAINEHLSGVNENIGKIVYVKHKEPDPEESPCNKRVMDY